MVFTDAQHPDNIHRKAATSVAQLSSHGTPRFHLHTPLYFGFQCPRKFPAYFTTCTKSNRSHLSLKFTTLSFHCLQRVNHFQTLFSFTWRPHNTCRYHQDSEPKGNLGPQELDSSQQRWNLSTLSEYSPPSLAVRNRQSEIVSLETARRLSQQCGLDGV